MGEVGGDFRSGWWDGSWKGGEDEAWEGLFRGWEGGRARGRWGRKTGFVGKGEGRGGDVEGMRSNRFSRTRVRFHSVSVVTANTRSWAELLMEKW